MWRIDISMDNNNRNRFLWAIKQIRIHMQTSRSFNIATLGLKKGWIDEKKSEDIICQWMNASASIFFNDFGHWLNHKLYAYSKYLVKHILHSLNMVLHSFSFFLSSPARNTSQKCKTRHFERRRYNWKEKLAQQKCLTRNLLSKRRKNTENIYKNKQIAHKVNPKISLTTSLSMPEKELHHVCSCRCAIVGSLFSSHFRYGHSSSLSL